MNKTPPFVTVSLVIALVCVWSCASAGKDRHLGNDEPEASAAEAEKRLSLYLDLRSRGDYDKCRTFLTSGFLKRFYQEQGTDYLDYYRNQNENLYKEPKIIDIAGLLGDGVTANVSVKVEGPGYTVDAIERYVMVQESGAWKISDWQIEWGEERLLPRGE